MANPTLLPPYLGDYSAGSTAYIFWNTYTLGLDPVTITGLAIADIEIYKNGSTTQRASDNGYALLDTDGIDFDEATGCHGFSIDLSDNSDAGFYARGNDYMVLVNAVTQLGRTIRFCAAVFSIENRAGRNGVGDYEVTLTIRTTAGVAVPGVSVWINTTNNRSGSVAGIKVTNVLGKVTFNLEYATYYIFCSLSGYSFAAASFTSAVGEVAFTKDIATSAAVAGAGAVAFYADSFLTRAIADVRESTDEPTQKAKYPPARIIDHLEKAYILILNEKNRNSRTPAVAKIKKTIVSGTTAYPLPHTVGSIHGIYKGDASGGKVYYDSRSKFNALGRGLWIENQTLHIQTTSMYGEGTEVTIEYVPSGIARLHNGTYTVNDDGDVVTFGDTPNVGTLDTHHEAYTGSIFRSLGVDGTTVEGNYLQERVITAYNEITREATLDAPLSPIPTTTDGVLYYEIAPAISKGMDTVVALYAAYRITATEGNNKRAAGILKAYRNEIRNVRLTAYYSYMPEAPIDRSDSNNNRRYRG